jgi:hypothetical protein
MPILYTIDKTRGHVETKVSGAVTVDEVLDHLNAARKEGVLKFRELIDARAVAPPYLSPKDIWSMAASVRAAKCEEPFGPRAVMVASDLIFGLTRIFTSLVSDYCPIRVFREQERAEAWLREWNGLAENP